MLEDRAEVERPVRPMSPMHSIEAVASAVFVASMAACWFAVASTATAPLLAAGGWMAKASKALEKH